MKPMPGEGVFQALLSQFSNPASSLNQPQQQPPASGSNQQQPQQHLLYINSLAASSFQGVIDSSSGNPIPNILPPTHPLSARLSTTMPPPAPASVAQVRRVVMPSTSHSSVFRRRPSLNGRRVLSEREKFVVFVKILMKCVDPKLRPRAKAVVTECTHRNRMGDSNYTPLQEAVERRLRGSVGELYWAKAKLYFDQYCQRKGLETVTAV